MQRSWTIPGLILALVSAFVSLPALAQTTTLSLEGTELVLEPNANPDAKTFQEAMLEQGIPLTAFAVEDVRRVRTDDSWMHQFLKRCNGDLDIVLPMLVECLKWRLDFDVNSKFIFHSREMWKI